MNIGKKLYLFFFRLNEEERFILFVVLGVAIFIVLLDELNWELSFLISWLLSGSIYLLQVFLIVLKSDDQKTRQRASKLTPNTLILLVLTIIMTLFGNLSVGILLTYVNPRHLAHSRLLLGLSTIVVIISWIMLHTGFAFHYSRLYYDEEDEKKCPFAGGMREGLIFPKSTNPSYIDFYYLAFTIGLTYSVSDVAVTRSDFRGVILVHSLVAFVFYSTIFSIVLSTFVTFWGKL
jgi:uncharacterized membrane protein